MSPASWGELVAVFCGGVAGTLARAGLAEGFPPPPGGWPWATFAANVAGALLLGYGAARWPRGAGASPYARPLLGAGFCGALTTFATFQLELLELLDERRWAVAGGYGAATLAAGLLAVAAGARLVGRRAAA